MPLEKTDENFQICQICGRKSSILGISTHIRQFHKTTPKNYYDKFYKTENEGKCLTCGKDIKFKHHYYKYCSILCRNRDPKQIQQAKETYFKKTPLELQTIKEKRENTMLLKYGVKNVGSSKQFQEKVEQTNIKKYGCKRPLQNKDIHDKVYATNFKRYGMANVGSLQFVVDKRKSTMLLKYGVENCQQVKEICEKSNRSAKQTHPYTLPSGKIIYKMGYEPQFLDYVFKNNILTEEEIDYHPKGIKYNGVDGKQHYYFPDFYIPKWNLIVEIKSTYTLMKDINVYLKEAETKKQGFKYIRIININNTQLNFQDFLGDVKNL